MTPIKEFQQNRHYGINFLQNFRTCSTSEKTSDRLSVLWSKPIKRAKKKIVNLSECDRYQKKEQRIKRKEEVAPGIISIGKRKLTVYYQGCQPWRRLITPQSRTRMLTKSLFMESGTAMNSILEWSKARNIDSALQRLYLKSWINSKKSDPKFVLILPAKSPRKPKARAPGSSSCNIVSAVVPQLEAWIGRTQTPSSQATSLDTDGTA